MECVGMSSHGRQRCRASGTPAPSIEVLGTAVRTLGNDNQASGDVRHRPRCAAVADAIEYRSLYASSLSMPHQNLRFWQRNGWFSNAILSLL